MKTLKHFYVLFFLLSFFLLHGCSLKSKITKSQSITKTTIQIDTIIEIEPKKDLQKDFISQNDLMINLDTLVIDTETTETKVFLNKRFPKNTIIAETSFKSFSLPIKINETKIINTEIKTKEKTKKSDFEFYIWFIIISVFVGLMISHSYKIIK